MICNKHKHVAGLYRPFQCFHKMPKSKITYSYLENVLTRYNVWQIFFLSNYEFTQCTGANANTVKEKYMNLS